MAVYNISGGKMYAVNSVGGNELNEAYDFSGNQMLQSILKVMTYNVQHFTGINSQTEMQSKIINGNAPDIISFQEFSATRAIPTVGQAVLTEYPYVYISDHLNYLSVASKIPLEDIMCADYKTQDPDEKTQWGETRAYFKAYFRFNGKDICFINTHLAVLDESVRNAQFLELVNMAMGEGYTIIAGDFNTAYSDFTSDTYTNTTKKFLDAKYEVFNSIPSVGITKTWTGITSAASLADFTANPDNIFTSGNIHIQQRTFDTTKLSYLDGNPIDHIAMVATLEVT